MLSLYAKGLSTGEISGHFAEISPASGRDHLAPRSRRRLSHRSPTRSSRKWQDWSARPLDEVYAAVFVDAIVVKVRDGQVANRPIYVSLDGHRDVLGLWAGTGGEGAEFGCPC